MSSDTDTNNRDGILRALEAADVRDAELEKKARELLVTATRQRDLGKAFSEIIKALPDDSAVSNRTWTELRARIDGHAVQASAVTGMLISPIALYTSSVDENFVVSTATTSSVVTASFYFEAANRSGEEWYDTRFAPRLTRLNEVIQQSIEHEYIERLLRDLGLDRDKGDIKSPLICFQEAYLALNQADIELPTGSSILMPLRDCILGISSALLPRRPEQVKTGSLAKQIRSIGEQCKRDGFTDEYISALGHRAENLCRTYSNYKDKRISREELLVVFHDGVFLIRGFLAALDPTKLK